MGYYLRVLSTSADSIRLRDLQAALNNARLEAKLAVEKGTPEAWEQLLLSHSDGTEIAEIERNVVEAGSLGADELEEFAEEVAGCRPESAAQWLRSYFPRVRCVYPLRLLDATDHRNGWEIVGEVKNKIWSSAPAIIQADLEGFSNEDGYHILWQFSESVKGEWWMGVLQGRRWIHFQMDLGNPRHREAFLRGEVPPGVRIAR